MPKKTNLIKKNLAVGQVVFDTWQPFRYGKVEKVLKNTVKVKWLDGESSIYDKSHQKFISKFNIKKVRENEN